MKSEEYLHVQNAIATLEVLIAGLDLKGFIEAANTAETLAPVLDPTLFMKGADALAAIKKRAEALREFQRVCESVPV